MGYTCNSSTWEVVGRGSGVEGYPWLQDELEASLGSVRDLVSNNKTKPRAGEMAQRVRTLPDELSMGGHACVPELWGWAGSRSRGKPRLRNKAKG